MPGIDLSLTDGVRQVRRSGKPAWSDVYLSPVRNSRGQVFATMGASYDITSRRQAEEALRESERRLAT
ncbi:MAG: PAS domain S-box protein, partial [Anaerolineales bacterium]|nr:PAS domain S-box protein [Anaerolineales bacterium]